MSDLSIVIVNWNVRDLLKNCLESILENSDELDIEVWVVDNDSSDGSQDMVEADFSQVNLIKNRVNLGFGRANNQAIKKCTSQNILLLNPDTIVQRKALTRLLGTINSPDQTLGAVGPMILSEEGMISYECARNFPTPASECFAAIGLDKTFPLSRIFGRYTMSFWNHEDSREVRCISGACMLIKKAVLEQVEGFDEEFFLYGEDIDLCFRIEKAGYTTYYEAAAKITHLQGKSTKNDMQLASCESMHLFFRKNYGRRTALMYRMSVLISALPMLAAAAVLWTIRYRTARYNWGYMLKRNSGLLMWALGFSRVDRVD